MLNFCKHFPENPDNYYGIVKPSIKLFWFKILLENKTEQTKVVFQHLKKLVCLAYTHIIDKTEKIRTHSSIKTFQLFWYTRRHHTQTLRLNRILKKRRNKKCCNFHILNHGIGRVCLTLFVPKLFSDGYFCMKEGLI